MRERERRRKREIISTPCSVIERERERLLELPHTSRHLILRAKRRQPQWLYGRVPKVRNNFYLKDKARIWS